MNQTRASVSLYTLVVCVLCAVVAVATVAGARIAADRPTEWTTTVDGVELECVATSATAAECGRAS